MALVAVCSTFAPLTATELSAFATEFGPIAIESVPVALASG